MGPDMVLVLPPDFQLLAGMGDAGEDRLVQKLIRQARFETFVEPVLLWLAWRDVVPLEIALLSPPQESWRNHVVARTKGAVSVANSSSEKIFWVVSK